MTNPTIDELDVLRKRVRRHQRRRVIAEEFARQALSAFEDTAALILTRQGRVLWSLDHTRSFLNQVSADASQIPNQGVFAGLPAADLPGIREIADLNEILSSVAQGEERSLEVPGVDFKVRVTAKFVPVRPAAAPETLAILLVLRTTAAPAAAGNTSEVSQGGSVGLTVDQLNEELKNFSASHGGTLDITVWLPDADEGAKLLTCYSVSGADPTEFLVTSIMFFAMEEMGQVDKMQFWHRVMEDKSSIVSIRDAEGGKLIGAVLFTGDGAGKIPTPVAQEMAKKSIGALPA